MFEIFEPIKGAIKFRNIAAKWTKATGVDPGDKGQIDIKAMSYIDNLGLDYEDAWLTALVNWMLDMPSEDSRKLMANGVIEFLNSYEDKIPLSMEITNSAREAAIT